MKNIETLTPEQVDEQAKVIGEKLNKIIFDANTKCNKILNKYGVIANVTCEIVGPKETIERREEDIVL